MREIWQDGPCQERLKPAPLLGLVGGRCTGTMRAVRTPAGQVKALRCDACGVEEAFVKCSVPHCKRAARVGWHACSDSHEMDYEDRGRRLGRND